MFLRDDLDELLACDTTSAGAGGRHPRARRDVVVSREPHHASKRYADPDVGIAVRDASRTAERRLLDYKQRQRGDIKVKEEFFTGQVSQLYPATTGGSC